MRIRPADTRGIALAAAGILMIGSLSACTPTAETEELSFSDAGIDWAACTGDDAVIDGLECATYAVPLDYREADGEKIDLALRRMPATGQSQGTVFFNPGGPGGTGSGQFPEWYLQFPEKVRESFDLVSWDPRGIGSSTAVQCYPNQDAEDAAIGPAGVFPTTFAEQKTYADAYTGFARSCADRAGDLAAHVSTADTARDLEQLRRAVGGEKLNYWGVSYGTFLGMTYANLFPDEVRTLVLDGNLAPDNWTNKGVSPAQESLGMRIGSTDNAEVFDQFLVLCTEAGQEACAFAEATPDLTRQKWRDLLDRLAQAPVTLGEGAQSKTVDLPDLVADVSNALDIVWEIKGSAQGWAGTAGALQAVWQAAQEQPAAASPGDGGAATGADAAPSAAEEPYTGPEQAFAVACGDASSIAPERVPTLGVEAQQKAGYLGLSTLYFDVPCAYWSIRAADPYAGPWDVKTSAPALVVNTTHDPSTPYPNAVLNAGHLEGSVLLSVNGYGHTSLLNKSTCADDAISAYFLDQSLPADGTYCAQDIQPFQQ